ncbi:hypothetical protein DL89DRAFT_294370 [Linderina pennispora]|uniref:Uncharacterized protein n=1 Tax=Linderina pennispora TaxID=61395 RepID=A0A1Y1W2P9_9FUNG|nr:uncharacterized protein DL89DRAFT_294370 [Linderina pennispora]ORX67809.1 hypothetical protein DL89DRAFT_294370 [Linderina pennispora]
MSATPMAMSNAGWTKPFEQIEAIVFTQTPTDNFNEQLRALSTAITTYLDGQKPDEAKEDEAHKKLANDLAQIAVEGFVAGQRKEIDRYNQEEFLKAAEGREETSARTDANGTSRGVQIHKDETKTETGALERSTGAVQKEQPPKAPQKLDGLQERVENIRQHLNAKFVPSSASIFRRVAALEDKIMLLERDLPEWAAANFCQPNRQYTQPPPITMYRILSPDSSEVPERTRAAARTGGGKSTRMPAGKHHRAYSKPYQPKRQGSGKPIFHACGRGVNSSLTRSVIAQLQMRQQAAAGIQKPKGNAEQSQSPASHPQVKNEPV